VGDLDGALEDYDQALRLKPNAMTYLGRGCLRKKKGDQAGALKDFDQAIRRDAGYAMAYNCRSVLKKKMGDWRGAFEDIDEAIRLCPESALYYTQRGIFWESTSWVSNFWEKASDDFQTALRLEPGYEAAVQGYSRVSGKMFIHKSLKKILPASWH
jgi:tetratricopeptide (TPR) repeat protein